MTTYIMQKMSFKKTFHMRQKKWQGLEFKKEQPNQNGQKTANRDKSEHVGQSLSGDDCDVRKTSL